MNLFGWFTLLAIFWCSTVPSYPFRQSQPPTFFSDSRSLRDLSPTPIFAVLGGFDSLRSTIFVLRPMTIRGGARPDHLPRSFKRALRRHTKARLQEQGKGKLASLARKIAAINNARKLSAPRNETFSGTQQLAIADGSDSIDESRSHSSSEIGGRGGWLHAIEKDPADMTVLLQVGFRCKLF